MVAGTAGVENTTGLSYGDRGSGTFWNEILKDLYLPIMQEVMIFPDTTLNLLKRMAPKDFGGKFAYFTVHTGPGNGRSSIGPDGYLPDPGAETWDRAAIPMRHYRARIKVDELTQEVSDQAMYAWVEGTSQEMEYASKHAKRDLNRQLHGDGTGRLAMVSSASGTTLDLTVPDGYVQSGSMDNDPTENFYVGQRLAGWDSSGNIDAAGEITSITDGNTIVVSETAGDWDNVDGFISSAARNDLSVGGTTDADSTGYQRELMGLGGIFSDQDPSAYWESEITNFQNIASTEGFNAATISANGGTKRALTLKLLQNTLSSLHKATLGDIDFWLCSYETHDTYYDLLESQREFQVVTPNGPVSQMDGHIDSVTYNRKPFIADRDCARNRLYGVPMDVLGMLQVRDWSWMSKDGNVLHRMTDKEAYQATLACDMNTYVTWRQRCLLIADLLEV